MCVWLMGRKDPCGRPWLTALCLGVLLLLPVLSVLPKVQVEILQTENSAVAGVSGWGIAEVLAVLWLAVVVLLVFRVIRSELVLRKWLNNAQKSDDHSWRELLQECGSMLDVKTLPELRLKKELSSPVVAGLLKPVIIMPLAAEDWNIETKKMAVLHELGHIQRRDLWVRLAAEFACVLHWYNPLVWWLRAKLLTQCEYACDALVISSGADRRSYIRALCDVVESAMADNRPLGVMAMADHAPLKLRVNRLLSGANMGKPWLAITAATMTTATALGLSLVRPAYPTGEDVSDAPVYSQQEIDLRHSADPFPGE